MALPYRRNRSAPEPAAADVARRRLAALSAQLAPDRGEGDDVEPDLRPQAPSAPMPAAPAGRHAQRPVGGLRRCADWCADRLPAAVLAGRPGLGSAQFGLVCLVVALGLAAAAWWTLRAGGETQAAPPRPVTTSPAPVDASSAAAPAQASAQASPAAGRIVVDVVGGVRRPGIVVLRDGARVVDAVRAAGGLRRGVDRAAVNLARVLTDGEQLLVGVRGAAAAPAGGSPSASASPGGLVNINTADQAALETLPGIGPVTAAAILQWRADNGPFSSVDELLEVDGIGEATLADIAPYVTL